MEWYRQLFAGHSLQMSPASMRLALLVAPRSTKPSRFLFRRGDIAVAFVLPFYVQLGNRTSLTSRHLRREGFQWWLEEQLPTS
jgi:hypothetical protein